MVAQLGKLGVHSYTLTFPSGWNCRPTSLLTLNCAKGGGGERDSGKVKIFLCPLPYLISGFSAPTVCWNFSAELLDFRKTTPIHWWVSNIVFFKGKTIENSYSAILRPSFLGRTLRLKYTSEACSLPLALHFWELFRMRHTALVHLLKVLYHV